MNIVNNDYWEFFKVAVMPVVIFSLGFGLNSLVTYRKEQKRLSDIRVYFHTLVELECESAYLLANQYIKHAEKLKDVGSYDVVMETVVGTPIESIKAINKQDLYKIFLKGKGIADKTRSFNSVISSINTINSTLEDAVERNESFMINVNIYISRWDPVTFKTNKMIESVMGTTNLKDALNSSDKYIVGIAQILDSYKYTGNLDLPFTYKYENYVHKLTEYFNLPKNRKDKRSTNLLIQLWEWEQIYINIKLKYEEGSRSSEKIANNLIKSANRIKEIMKEFE